MGKRNKTPKGPFTEKGSFLPIKLVNREKVVPDVFGTQVVYKQRVNMGGATGIITLQKFRGNDLFDPDISGSGAQPYGFDELMRLYSKFRVLGSRIEIWNASVGTTAGTQTFEFVVVPTATGVSFTTMEDASAAPFARWAINQGLSNPAMHIVKTMSTARIEGIPLTKVRDEDTYSGDASASPLSQWDWQLLSQAVDRASTLSCFTYVTVTYDVEFFGRVNLALS